MFTIYRIKGLMVVAFTKNAPFGSPAQIAPADRSSPSTTGSTGTSASSSWMNLVERWFAESPAASSADQPTAASPNSKPASATGSASGTRTPGRSWTKTTDEILETLAAHYEPIIDSRH
jgi:hypothetical protein